MKDSLILFPHIEKLVLFTLSMIIIIPIAYSGNSHSQSSCNENFFICIDMGDCESIGILSPENNKNIYFIDNNYFDLQKYISTVPQQCINFASYYLANLCLAKIHSIGTTPTDIFSNQKDLTKFVKCYGYYSGINSGKSMVLTNERTIPNPPLINNYYEYLLNNFQSTKQILVMFNTNRTLNNFVYFRNSTNPNNYCVFENSSNANEFRNCANVTGKFQPVLIEDLNTPSNTPFKINAQFTLDFDLSNVDNAIFSETINKGFSIFIRYFIDFMPGYGSTFDCVSETQQYITLSLSFLRGPSSYSQGWLGICFKSSFQLQVSIKYGSAISDFASITLKTNMKRLWNELSIVFNNSNPLLLYISLNLTTLSPQGDKSVSEYLSIEPKYPDIMMRVMYTHNNLNNKLVGIIQTDYNAIFALNFIAYYNGNVSTTANSYITQYNSHTIDSLTAFPYPFFVNNNILQEGPNVITFIEKILNDDLFFSNDQQFYFPSSYVIPDNYSGVDFPKQDPKCGYQNNYCRKCGRLSPSYCIVPCNSIANLIGNQRLGAFKYYCFCAFGYSQASFSDQCLPITNCNIRCGDKCYASILDTQCNSGCNDTYNINVDPLILHDFFDKAECKCKLYTYPYSRNENICYYDYNCARTCNLQCINRNNDYDCIDQITTLPICDPNKECLESCNPFSYNIVNTSIPNTKNMILMDCSCLPTFTPSENYPEICTLKDQEGPPPVTICHPFCNGECLAANDLNQCFIYCNPSNKYLIPFYYNSSVKTMTKCWCSLGDIYLNDSVSSLICPYTKPECSINCLKYCDKESNSSTCFFNCKYNNSISPGTKLNSMLNCPCHAGFAESANGCQEVCKKGLNYGNLDCDPINSLELGCNQDCSVTQGYYCIHYGSDIPYKDICYSYISLEESKYYMTEENIIVIQSDFLIFFSNKNPTLFVTNSSTFDKLMQIPIQYVKLDIKLKALIIKVNNTLLLYCSRNIVVDLTPLKIMNAAMLRIIGSKLVIPLKKNLSSKCIVFTEKSNIVYKGLITIKYFLKVLS